MKNYLLSVLFLGLIFFSGNLESLATHAPFRAGFYLNQAQDTVKGWIKLLSREEHQKNCVFKGEEKGKEQIFAADEILAYGFNKGKVYRSRSPHEEGNLIVFMELLQSGRVNLYRYNDRFFLEYGQPQKFKELKSTEVSYNEGYRVYTENKHEYVEVIKEAMADCPNVAYPISSGREKLLIREKTFMDLVDRYHACFQEKVIQPDTRDPLSVKMGFLLGLSASSLDYRARSPFDVANASSENAIFSVATASYDISMAPLIGFYLDINTPRSRSGIGFRGEFYYQPFLFKGSNEYFDPQFQATITDEIDLVVQRIALPLGIKKRLGANRSPFYIILGINPQLNVNRQYTLFRESDAPPMQGPFFAPVQTIWARNNGLIGLWAKLGVSLSSQKTGSLQLEIRGEYSGQEDGLYESGFGFNPSGRSRNPHRIYSLSLLLAYEFGS